MNFVEDFLAEADLADLPSTLSTFRPAGAVLLSSSRVTSRCATVLLLDSTGALQLVAKVARRPQRQERLAVEFDMLRLLAGRNPSDPIAPLPLALVQHRGHWLLLQSAVNGTALRSRGRGRSLRPMWERVETWLLDLASTTARVDDAWHAEQVVEPLRRIELALPATGDEKRLFAATRDLTQELVSASMPAPIEHGDLFKAHFAVAPGGSLAAIDWELGRPQGLAGADAAIFLFDVLRPARMPWDGEATARAYAEHFLDRRGVARAWMQDHLERQGVQPSFVDHVLLATFARRALHIWGPVVSETDSASVGQRDRVRALFRGLWSVRLWRMTLEQVQEHGGAYAGASQKARFLRGWR